MKKLLNNILIFLFLFLPSFSVRCFGGDKTDDLKISFTAHPRFYYVKKEINDIKNNPTRLKSVLKEGEDLLKQEIVIPKDQTGGQWYFYYRCSKDNGSLKFISMKEHQCIKCGTVYKDEQTSAAYRTILYGKADSIMQKLALAYAVSGDDKFVNPVKKAFLELVELYPTLERHDRWGRKGILAVVGGRRYCQHLTEATSIIKLAEAYDLCCNSREFSDEDRKKIEKNLLEFVVNEIKGFEFFVGRKNNHQTWFNAAYANVGVVTGNQALIDLAINGKGGFLEQVKTSVTDDGIWYEGTISYHFYALQAIIEMLKALKSVDIDFADNERLKSLWLGPLNLTFPDGKMPALNDGDPYNLNTSGKVYQFAYEYFKDPVFAKITAKDKKKKISGKELPSCVLKDIGIAVLRHGQGKGADCGFLDYGIHGDHHGHPDKLNIMLYCLGMEMFPDSGRISYSVPEYNSWARTTVAHNTVVLNKKNQSPTRGTLLGFVDEKDFTACMAQTTKAYAGANMKRCLVLGENFMLDYFEVEKGKSFWWWGSEPIWDWIIHCRGLLKSNNNESEINGKLGEDNGYQHLKNIRKVDLDKPVFFDFVNKDKSFLRMYLIHADGDIYTGEGIGVSLNEKVPFVLWRKTTPKAGFLAVYDLSGTGNYLKTIEVKNLNGKDAGAEKPLKVLLKTENGPIEITIKTNIDINKEKNSAEEDNWIIFQNQQEKVLGGVNNDQN